VLAFRVGIVERAVGRRFFKSVRGLGRSKLLFASVSMEGVDCLVESIIGPPSAVIRDEGAEGRNFSYKGLDAVTILSEGLN
jgi:hypothetical protein